MREIKVVDLDGLWVVNPHAYPFVDPETGVRFEPGIPTKVAYASKSWIAGQVGAGTLAKAADPMKPEKDPPKAESPRVTGKAEG